MEWQPPELPQPSPPLQPHTAWSGKTHRAMRKHQVLCHVLSTGSLIRSHEMKGPFAFASPASLCQTMHQPPLQAIGTSSVHLTIVDLYNDTFVDLLDSSCSTPRSSVLSPTSKAGGSFASPRASRRGSISSISSPRPIVYSAPTIRKHVSIKATATGVTLQGAQICNQIC